MPSLFETIVSLYACFYVCLSLHSLKMDYKGRVKDLFTLIEKHREFIGITKRQVAIKADITPQYYNDLIKGDKIPSISIVFALCDAVGADLKLLFRL